MNGGARVAQVLKKQGVQQIFTLCGGHISPILVEAKNLGIQIVDVRHEANAAFSAVVFKNPVGTAKEVFLKFGVYVARPAVIL